MWEVTLETTTKNKIRTVEEWLLPNLLENTKIPANLKKDTTFHMSLYVHVFVTISALKPYST